MILLDASVWIDHLRRREPRLEQLLSDRRVLMHPFVVAEVALGSIARRAAMIGLLESFPQAAVATHEEVLALIEGKKLYGLGIGYVDVHLLASARLADARLWTRDRRLRAAADLLRLSAPFDLGG
ncbi:type II toxin-antitoxin system VapC family toxin [Bosea sp. PAMC 26642]|uniref:type II toxin-antitoxin system VapC family toxin n=1 Tax=Bosea sp. (strain PAMC 26642) TaxID=1792307 RepID=UPI0007701A70|nr:PIN domain-containing protein [Bosea sp. PAMC 26642]AMJ61848.1 ribonuclease [Bosea sp. PAMC 26642]